MTTKSHTSPSSRRSHQRLDGPVEDEIDLRDPAQTMEPIRVVGQVDTDVIIEPPTSFYATWVKYPAERLLAGVILIVVLPVILLVALAIRINMGPGVFFRQRRVGKHGEVFTMWKFRSMDPDRRAAEQSIDWPDRRRTHKSRHDPRQRKLGRILRSTSLDEIPQLWDVVRGKMSLIGPRPELESVVSKFDLWDHPRHLVKPGITGKWQVSEVRDDLLYENLHIDVDYVREISLRTDAKIAVATVAMPFRRTGW